MTGFTVKDQKEITILLFLILVVKSSNGIDFGMFPSDVKHVGNPIIKKVSRNSAVIININTDFGKSKPTTEGLRSLISKPGIPLLEMIGPALPVIKTSHKLTRSIIDSKVFSAKVTALKKDITKLPSLMPTLPPLPRPVPKVPFSPLVVPKLIPLIPPFVSPPVLNLMGLVPVSIKKIERLRGFENSRQIPMRNANLIQKLRDLKNKGALSPGDFIRFKKLLLQ